MTSNIKQADYDDYVANLKDLSTKLLSSEEIYKTYKDYSSVLEKFNKDVSYKGFFLLEFDIIQQNYICLVGSNQSKLFPKNTIEKFGIKNPFFLVLFVEKILSYPLILNSKSQLNKLIEDILNIVDNSFEKLKNATLGTGFFKNIVEDFLKKHELNLGSLTSRKDFRKIMDYYKSGELIRRGLLTKYNNSFGSKETSAADLIMGETFIEKAIRLYDDHIKNDADAFSQVLLPVILYYYRSKKRFKGKGIKTDIELKKEKDDKEFEEVLIPLIANYF